MTIRLEGKKWREIRYIITKDFKYKKEVFKVNTSKKLMQFFVLYDNFLPNFIVYLWYKHWQDFLDML